MKLSFIIPVYNVASYLRKCVDSLLAQDYIDFEIILVDDGSTDGSGDICDEYATEPTSVSSLKGRAKESFASVWGAHTADSTQYNLLKANAKANRKEPTEAESAMWDLLKANNIGYHFRRQHIILDYIADFICIEKGLVIELDGGYHNAMEQKEYDEKRTAHLLQLGYTELRFTNEEVLCNPAEVIAKIKATANKLPSFKGRDGVRPTIKVIHQENAGLSAARNSGLAIAQGDYVCFVDSDDYWQPNVLGALMMQIERDDLYVLRFKYQYVREVESQESRVEREYETYNPYKTNPYREDDYSEVVTDGVSFLNTRMGTNCYAVTFIVRRELMDDCLFTEGIYFEDTDWTPRMLVNAQRVASTDRVVYNYLLTRQGSITNAPNRAKQQKVLDDKMRLVGEMQRQATLARVEGYDDAWFSRMIAATVISIFGILSTEFYADRENYLAELQQMDIYPLCAISLKARLINLSPRLAVLLLHLKNGKKMITND